MDINEIKEYLPHRYPFLLVDRVVELAPDVAPENLEHLARSVALIAEHLNTNPPTSGRSAVVY